MAERQIIIRRKLPKETRIQNNIIWDDNLSHMARFAMIAMLSLPDTWDYSVRGMAVKLGISKDTMAKYMNELERAGYLKRMQEHGSNGAFTKACYILTDVPWSFDEEESPCPKNSDTDAPCPNLPDPVTPDPINSPQKKRTKQKRRTKQENPPISPMGDVSDPDTKGGSTELMPKHRPERFSGFWSYYPRHVKRDRAVAAWDRLKPDDALIDTMGRALAKQVAFWNATGTELKFIPHAATWLNQKRWADPPEEYQLSGQRGQPSGGWAEDREVL